VRGNDEQQSAMFSYISAERRVPKDHPLRLIRTIVDKALVALSPTFNKMYSQVGRPSIAPEKLLRALLLQILYTLRSERQLMEQLDYNLLFRWFVGLNMDDPVWDATTFCKNRDRLLEGEVAELFFDEVSDQAREHGLLSSEHFTVDGTLIEAWAGQKSFKKKPQPEKAQSDQEPPDDRGNPTIDFHGEKRSNKTHQSTTDPEARLYKKGQGREAKLAYLGHVLTENRNGLVVKACLTEANGFAEREAAVKFAAEISKCRRVTMGGDKAFDTKGVVEELRRLNVTPHVAQNAYGNHTSAIDNRTTRHVGYAISQNKRKRIEEVFGWMKTIAMMRKTRHRGVDRVGWAFRFAATAYNLVRMRKLIASAA
jgi:transposase